MGRREVEAIVTNLIFERGSVSSGEVAKASQLTRQAIHRYLRRMVGSGELVREGKGRSIRYRPRKAAFNAHLKNDKHLTEDQVWDELRPLVPRAGPFENARNILAHAVLEILNNALSHSASPVVDVRAEIDVEDDVARVTVADRGVGIKRSVLRIVSKKRVSTKTEGHSGEGLFFTSQMIQKMEIRTNGRVVTLAGRRSTPVITEAPTPEGTTIFLETSLKRLRPLKTVYAQYDEKDSRIIVALQEHGVRLVARSEAKRLLVGLEKFREVIFDFAGVEGVGQGFADEVFRVWAKQHPDTKLSTEHMATPVSVMVERARRSAT